jgi:hypothetical protein
LTADKLNHVTAGTVAGGGLSSGSVGLTIGAVHILSVYAKAGTKGWLALNTESTATPSEWCYFNLTTGALGNLGSEFTARGIIDVGGGWYRCWGITKVIPGARGLSVRVCEANATVTCTSPGDIYLWGAQTEQITAATTPGPYIPTTTAAVHAPRFDYDPVTHAPKGLLIEEARTNVVWPNRDLTHARWVRTNCTAALNQVGLDGGANTASSLTATAANATCLQTTSIASSARYQSAYVKRITGSGVVNMTTNGGTTWTPIAVTASWTRVEIPTATLANPSVGFQLVTSGDAIAVDAVQNENGVFATSAILTTTATVARATDIAMMTGTNFSSWYNQSTGTLVAEFDMLKPTQNQTILQADNNTVSEYISFWLNGGLAAAWIKDNNVNQVTASTAGIILANTVYKLGLSYALNDVAVCINGATPILDTAATMPTPTQLRIGTDGVAADYLNGHTRRIRFWNTAKSDAELQTLTT